MKPLFTLLLAALAFVATAQTQHIPYQGAAVGPQNRVLKNKTVQLRLSILDSSATGNVVYQETHSVTTDSKGLFSVSIGGGTPVVGSFSQIAWAAGAKFLQTEMDTALSGVFLTLGSTELKSVPYALYAQSAQQANSAQTALRSDSSNYATTSQTATTAQSAINAQTAVRSDSSNFANSASTAQTATTAQSSISAQTAVRSDSSNFSTTSQAWVRMSTSQRDALTNIPAGTVIFNTTTGCPNYYNGSSWYQQCGSCSPEPSVANAGPDVLNSTATSITLQASNPSVGTGTWSILFGSGGTLTNANSPNATFTGVAGTIYTLRFTVSNACGSTFDEMNVSFTSGGGSGCSPQPSVANAGPDAFNQCATTALNASSPSVGTGTWSIISGNGGSFSNTASPTATFTGTAGQTYTLRWTVSNGCGSTADEVTVSFVAPPTTANAGLDQLNVTTPTAVLNATAPTQGSGIWTVVAGVGGSLSGASSPNGTFTGTPGQSYTLRWTVTNACGSSSSDDMTVVFGATGGTPCTPLPTTANAGPDSGAFCPGSLLYANSAYVGTGQWTVLSGSSFYFSDVATHNSAFYGSSGQTYTLRWTITTACGLSFDDVVLTVPGTVNSANADQVQANVITIDTTYLLKANAANAGSFGTWSVIGGVAGTFTNINSPTATYRGFNNTFSTLKWTISNGCGVQSSDTVRLEFRLSTACNGVSSMTDSRDGQVYPIVGIGTQCWMAKNMNVGTIIPSANGDQTNNQVIEKYCYNDQLSNCTTYGGLYQWAETVQYENSASNLTSPNPAFTGNVRGICPTGWHLPSDAEWTALENALGASNVAGTTLKSTIGWYIGNGNNSSGFNALPCGIFSNYVGSFRDFNYKTYFWTNFEQSSKTVFNRYLDTYNSTIGRGANSKIDGLSARCIRD
jgi:uncharacterized protein (TIGR02145 family)